MKQENENKITLYQINGWFLGKVDCEFHCPELPPERPNSSPLRPTCIKKIKGLFCDFNQKVQMAFNWLQFYRIMFSK